MEYSKKRQEETLLYRARKKEKGFVFRAYWIPADKAEVVKEFIKALRTEPRKDA
jgi:hypothetical protein